MAVPAMASGEDFRPEAAIVNYFGPSMSIICGISINVNIYCLIVLSLFNDSDSTNDISC